MNKDNGGPAFPGLAGCYHNGMSLRDYIAIHALQDDLSLPQTIRECAAFLGLQFESEYSNRQHWVQVVSKARYIYADAMLAERRKNKDADINRS